MGLVTRPIVRRDLHNDGELKGADVRRFRSLTMRGSYLGHDRYDIQNASKELATGMKTPANEDMVSLKRLARYLNGKPRCVQTFRRQSGRNPGPQVSRSGVEDDRFDSRC